MKTLYTLLFLAISNLAFSQEVASFPGIPYTAFNYFDVDDDFIATLGSCDQFWYSTDDGASWSHEVMDDRYFAIKILKDAEERKMVIGGASVLILKDVDNNTQANIMADAINNNGFNRRIEIVGDNVYVFNNYGIVKGRYDGTTIVDIEEVWQVEIENDYVYTTSVFGKDIFLGMRNGGLYRYNTETDEVVLLNELGNWIFNIEMGSANVGYAVVQGEGNLMKTEDGGYTWNVLEEMPEGINPLAYGEDVVITVNTNRIYQSLDGGASSTYIPTAENENWSLASAAMFSEDGTLYIVGRGSMIVKSEDYGATYTHLNPYNRSYLYGLDMEESGQGMAVGTYNRILSTSDYGTTWSEMELDIPGDKDYNVVEILKDGKILIGTYDEFIMYDNGIVSETEKYVLDIHEDEDFLLLLKYDFGVTYLEKSTDGGNTWTEVLELEGYTDKISKSMNGKYFVGDEDGVVHVSEDNGDTWATVQFGTQDVFEVNFVNDDVGYIVVQGKIQKTVDGGDSFYDVAYGYAFSDFTIIDENQMLCHSRQNNGTWLYESVDGGENFSLHFLSCSPTNKMLLNAEGNLVLAQSFGHISVVAPSPMTSNEDVEIEDKTFSIYPNPVSGNHEVFVDVAFDRLSIYSIDGSLMDVSISGNAISTRNLSSGIYIVSAEKNGKLMHQKLVVE